MSGPSGKGASQVEAETKLMTAIAFAVAAGAVFAPKPSLRLLGVPKEDVTPAAILGWRLVAARNVALAGAALGNETVRNLFLPVQVLDQIAWWEMYRSGKLSLRTTAMSAAASGAIIALDVRRRLRG